MSKYPLRFGIPGLDRLLGDSSEKQNEVSEQKNFGFASYSDSGTSLCLIGPHGTGKSVLALHFASRYFADCFREPKNSARVFYVSTDLSHAMALNVWQSFALDTPEARYISSGSKYCEEGAQKEDCRRLENQKIKLQRRIPEADKTDKTDETKDESLAAYLAECAKREGCCGEITFVDLAARSAGDDWGFIHRLIAVLPEPLEGMPRHLVVVDAVEGLETLVGEKDAFGEITSRRSRIAQMLRTAFNKCHLFFVVEEPAEGLRVPEEYVSDVVIRLRSVHQRGFDRRTVEVQKVRGQGQVRGQHPYIIRQGIGSYTGSQMNLDDRRTIMPKNSARAGGWYSIDEEITSLLKEKAPPVDVTRQPRLHVAPDAARLRREWLFREFQVTGSRPRETFGKMPDITVLDKEWHSQELLTSEPPAQAYVHVIHSLHFLTRSIMLGKGPSRPEPSKRFAEFGITHLDGMLGRDGPQIGLPCSTLTALIGDAGTHKSVLGKSFLYKGIYHELTKSPEFVKNNGRIDHIAILLTTNDIDAQGLARNFLRWAWLEESKYRVKKERHWFENFKPLEIFAGSADPEKFESQKPSAEFEERVEQLCEKNIICRRLEIHNQTSEVFMHVVRNAVEEAQHRIGIERTFPSPRRHIESWRIRLVLDDFSVLKGMYPDVREDSLFLSFLTFYLRREGISTLIIDTHPGRPDREGPALFDDELRALADNHLYTWRVGFHGESRIAISAIPPIHATERSRIRELKYDEIQKRPPVVDRGLELYAGLEHGNPSPIPLEVRLYTETGRIADYITEMNTILSDFFVPVQGNHSKESSQLVIDIKPKDYSHLHDFCNLQTEHALDHTLIFAVEESWAVGPPRKKTSDAATRLLPHPLREEEEYLTADLNTFENEPRQMFRGLRNTLEGEYPPDKKDDLKQERSRGTRASYFRMPGKEFCDENPRDELEGVDRIPFVWDFGFLMCREQAWQSAAEDKVQIGTQPLEKCRTVKEIFRQLPIAKPKIKDGVESQDLVIKDVKRPSWREFLGACVTVAQHSSYANEKPAAFDISTVSAETFSCLIFEIWASEIFDRERQKPGFLEDLVNPLSQRRWTVSDESQGLIEWLDDPAKVIDFYRAWLLLISALPLAELASPERPTQVVQRPAKSNSIASRHWYTTACEVLNQTPNSGPMLAVGLPGHFSTRGDWFLGVARGSKSDLLADRVLDIFSSRRNNLTRLYSGLGLPTRIMGTKKETGRLLTAMTIKDAAGLLKHHVRYRDLLALGVSSPGGNKIKEFHWLFRSSLSKYHKHSRIFQRWNSRTLNMWLGTRMEMGPKWLSGFEIYDALSQKYDELLKKDKSLNDKTMDKVVAELTENEAKNSWLHFKSRCKILKNLLSHSDKTESLLEAESES